MNCGSVDSRQHRLITEPGTGRKLQCRSRAVHQELSETHIVYAADETERRETVNFEFVEGPHGLMMKPLLYSS